MAVDRTDVALDIRSAWRNDALVSISAGIYAGRPPESSTELIEDALRATRQVA